MRKLIAAICASLMLPLLAASHPALADPYVDNAAVDELFEELRRDVAERGAARQQTDIEALEAELVDLAKDGGNHWASVRFSGWVRETPGETPVQFAEVWNLVKPADGSSGWLLAGIQQMH